MGGVKRILWAAAAAAAAIAGIGLWTGDDQNASVLKGDVKLPVTFIENRGQTDARVRFYANGPRFTFHLTAGEVVLSLVKSPNPREADRVVLGLRFLDGNPRVVVEGEERAPGQVNYFQGSDPSRWQTGLSSYAQVVYRDLWPGIDLRLRERAGSLKYEFRLEPGARVRDIHMAYTGSQGVSMDADGGLLIETRLGVLRDSAPVAYQEISGVRVPVESSYVLGNAGNANSSYGFELGSGYDPNRELVIDPGLEYSTFLGGAAHEYGAGIAVDNAGNAYVMGLTQSPDFPTTAGAFDRTGAVSNNLEVFIAKLNPTGTALIYSTFLGGSNFEWGRGLAVDAAGNAYVVGQTKSSNFPTTGGAFDTTFNVDTCPRCGIDQYDAFVTKLNPTGSALVYSTYLGGFDLDDAIGVAVDEGGNAYVVGETGSLNFPITAGVFQPVRNGAFDAFLTRFNAAGSALVFSTYLGGAEVDFAGHVSVERDGSGNSYITGITRSPNFPTTPGAFDTTSNGAFDIFVTKVNGTGSALIYSTFLGGVDMDGGGALAVDQAGNAIVAGGTISPDFPTTAGAFRTTMNGFSDGFVTKINPSGSALVYSTFIGGSDSDDVAAIELDADGNTHMGGSTASADFPVTADAYDRQFNGVWDVFIAELNANGSALRYSTFLGGTDSDGPSDIARSANGAIYVTGQTMSPDFPTTAGAFDRVFNGDPLIFWADAFVAKLTRGDVAPPPPPPPPPPSTSTLTVMVTGGRSARVTSTPAGIDVTTGNVDSAPFTNGTAIRLRSSREAVWSGACSSGGKKRESCTFTITKDSAVTADIR